MTQYRYSGSKTKAHPKGDHRRAKAKLSKVPGGWLWYQGCAQFMGGRWEGYVTYPRGQRVFKTKAEAMKHKPAW